MSMKANSCLSRRAIGNEGIHGGWDNFVAGTNEIAALVFNVKVFTILNTKQYVFKETLQKTRPHATSMHDTMQ